MTFLLQDNLGEHYLKTVEERAVRRDASFTTVIPTRANCRMSASSQDMTLYIRVLIMQTLLRGRAAPKAQAIALVDLKFTEQSQRTGTTVVWMELETNFRRLWPLYRNVGAVFKVLIETRRAKCHFFLEHMSKMSDFSSLNVNIF